MDFSKDSTWDWIQRIALILGALASLIVIVEFPEGSGPGATPPILEEPARTSPKPPPPEPTAAPPSPEVVEPVGETVYKTPHGERYHRPSCHHVRGKALAISLADARAMGLTPCGTCNPDP